MLKPNGILDVLDMQTEMLDNLKQRAIKQGVSNIITTHGDAQQLPYHDFLFDAVYMIATLGEIPNLAAAIKEIRRVLKPGGRLVMGEILPDPDYISLSALGDNIKKQGFTPECTSGTVFPYFARFYPTELLII